MISSHPLRRRPTRLALFGIGLALASALSCGREVTAPGGALAGAVQLRPVFAGLRLAGQGAPVSVSGLVDFVRVRIVLLRANGDTAVKRVVEFPADSQSLSRRHDDEPRGEYDARRRDAGPAAGGAAARRCHPAVRRRDLRARGHGERALRGAWWGQIAFSQARDLVTA